VAAISDPPMLSEMDADYSPQYVTLGRILRRKIESGQYKTGDALAATDLGRSGTAGAAPPPSVGFSGERPSSG